LEIDDGMPLLIVFMEEWIDDAWMDMDGYEWV
jgi:hypothetical protein